MGPVAVTVMTSDGDTVVVTRGQWNTVQFAPTPSRQAVR